MKTVSITIDRNFHIMNDDRFIMEKISMTADVEDSDPNWVADELRKQITENFKAAYPTVEEHLNFNVVRQVDYSQINYTGIKRKEETSIDSFGHSNKEMFVGIKEVASEKCPVADAEKVKKEMEAYTLGANIFKAVYELQVQDNPELKEVYDRKLAELENNVPKTPPSKPLKSKS